MPETPSTRIRLWPAAAILILAFLALAFLWIVPEMQRQQRYIRSAIVLMAGGFALGVWWLLFSKVRWRVRLAGSAAAALALAAAVLSLRIRGVDGDLLPIIEPRWKSRRSIAPPVPQNAAAISSPRARLSADFPQFYGPNRDAVLPDVELETNWTRFPPKELWRVPAGAAWSGFAVKDGLAITLEQRENSEWVIAYDLLTGKTAWTHASSARYSTTIAGEGPRSTPTIAGNRVLTFGATGHLACLDLASGRPLWEKNLAAETGARTPDWGFACSPLVTGDQVVVSVGGSNGRAVVGCGLRDGAVAWASGEGGSHYSSPFAATLLGQKQIVLFAGSIVGRDLAGQVLWQYRWPGGHPHITPPLIVSSNRFFASSGYGTGCELVQLERSPAGAWQAERVWKTMALKSKFGPLFQAGEFVYGLDDGIFCCVDLSNGERRWKEGRYGHGQGLLAGKVILLTSEKGELVLIEPNPDTLVELARFKVFNGKTWNPPALAGEYLVVRNDKEAACFRLALRKGGSN